MNSIKKMLKNIVNSVKKKYNSYKIRKKLKTQKIHSFTSRKLCPRKQH